MTNRLQICDSVFLVGGAKYSDQRDCLVYLIDLGELVLIDCGAGPGWPRIADNICAIGYDPAAIHTLFLTHGHVDHIGAADLVRARSECRIIAHQGDVQAIETGDDERTAASWYGLHLPGTPVDDIVDGPLSALALSRGNLDLIHTPGHTPGSMVAVLDTPDNHRVLFGQDIHGPFSPAFGSDTARWRSSMRDLIALEADILCEGHYGVFRGVTAVRDFIEEQLALNA